MTLELNTVHRGDCLEVMKAITDKSVDMILCDLPYGNTKNKWDVVIPFDALWEQYERVIKDNGAIVLTANQPFTSMLVSSNPNIFKYCLVWDKVTISNPLRARKQFLTTHEDVVVFYKKQPTYNPQMVEGTQWSRGGKKSHTTENRGDTKLINSGSDKTNLKFPKSILRFSNADKTKNVHPTQKPVPLFEYLIKTYSNEGDVVLDNCIGSGTTAVAAINTNRNFIGIEREQKYVEIARIRIAEASGS